MKLMIASDIHGSAKFCKQMLEAYSREGAEKLLLLGDLLYHGPRNDLPQEYNPKQVIKMLNERKKELLCVRGNCEAEVDQMVLEFPVLVEYMILYLDHRTIFVTHGHHYNLSTLPPLQDGDILLHGHTHVQAIQKSGEIWYLNPGSISIPKEGNQHSYMLYEEGTYTIKALDGTILKESPNFSTLT